MDLFSFALGFVSCIGCFLLLIYWPEVRGAAQAMWFAVADKADELAWMIRERIRR